MALPINIEDLIRRKVVENARVEYKKDWNPQPILHTICAFANDIENWGGGYIIIGIEEENGMPAFPITGLDKSSVDRINKELLEKCNLIEPRYLPVAEQTQFDGLAEKTDHTNVRYIFPQTKQKKGEIKHII